MKIIFVACCYNGSGIGVGAFFGENGKIIFQSK